MDTQCSGAQLDFQPFGRRLVTGRHDGGHMSSDGGGLLLREVDGRIGLTERLAGCFVDHRNPASVEHDVRALVAQRVHALALGYEDLNDHDALRRDAVLSLLVGRADPTGADRARARHRGAALASPSTLNRLELGRPEQPRDRYKRVVARTEALDDLLVELFMESRTEPPRELWLDLDATDDPLHGAEEGRFFHGYYRCYCYLPLYVFCGEHLLRAPAPLCRSTRPQTTRHSDDAKDDGLDQSRTRQREAAGPNPGGHSSYCGKSSSIVAQETRSRTYMWPMMVSPGSPSRVPAGTARVSSPVWPWTSRWVPQCPQNFRYAPREDS